MKFYKFHGNGNDFIMIKNLDGERAFSTEEIVRLCDRRYGIGADAVILVENGREGGDFFMDYWNSDGSCSEMCGNGTRCMAHFAQQILGFKGTEVSLDTRGGRKIVDILGGGLFRTNMGVPNFEAYKDFPRESQVFGGTEFQFVSMGNPHAVGFFENKALLEEAFGVLGRQLESDRRYFPNRINVNFVHQKGENHFGAQTFERGSGPTLACGTGTCAVFTVLTQVWKRAPMNQKIQIDVPGGALFFEYTDQGEILMTGSSAQVFEGVI